MIASNQSINELTINLTKIFDQIRTAFEKSLSI